MTALCDRPALDERSTDALRSGRRKARGVGRRPAYLLLGCALIGMLVLLRTHFCLSLVAGGSMRPGLDRGDLLLVDKQAYRRAAPKRGDIVVARSPNGLLVKRVVGLPGEEVEVRVGQLYINGLPVAEDYAVEPGRLSLRKGGLFDDKYALLGDNRSLPPSLSVHAVVAMDQIVGKVVYSLRLWPGPRHSPTVERPDAELKPPQSGHLAGADAASRE